MIPELTTEQWIYGMIAAVFVGLGKGGLPGAGNLAIIFMAMAFPSKVSVGILLPVLIFADVVAVIIYSQHARWKHLVKLLPWTLVGVMGGTWVLREIDDQFLTRLIGFILLTMVLLRWVSKKMGKDSDEKKADDRKSTTGRIWVPFTGIMGGVATMVANAAGPVVGIYLLISGLPKYALIGTAAWFFFIINLCKLPFQAAIGNLSLGSLKISIVFGMMAAVATSVAPRIVKYIPEKTFVILIWAFIIVAGLKMILF